MRIWALLGVCLSVLLLTACSANAPISSESTRTISPDAEYQTVVGLKDAFVAAGGDCDEWVEVEVRGYGGPSLVAQQGDCGRGTSLFTFASEGDRDSYAARLRQVANSAGIGIHMLVGGNWIVRTPNPDPIAEQLGGVVVAN